MKELFEEIDPEGFDFMKVDATYEGYGPVDYWFAEVTRVMDLINEECSEVHPIMYEGSADRGYQGSMGKLVVKPVDARIHAFRIKFASYKVLFDQELHDRIIAGRFTGFDMRISTNVYGI